MTPTRTLFSIFMTALLIAPLSLGATSASAQSTKSNGSFNTDQPIEILADSLEVQQEQQIATFVGNVQVIQGEMRLKAARLMVYYSDNKTANTSSSDTSAPKIRQIDAVGNVFLSNPRETAKGDKGTYDVINKKINLQGNVVLTQGQNVLRGEKMVLDLVSGRSQIVGSGAGNSSGRVRGLFVPQKKN